MADAVATQSLLVGSKKLIYKFTNISDGTGEAAVVKVDYSAIAPAGAPYPTIKKVWYTTSGMAVDIYFDATADVLALSLPADTSDTLCFKSIGGIPNNGGAGVTGDIVFTTRGHTAADTYVVVMELEM